LAATFPARSAPDFAITSVPHDRHGRFRRNSLSLSGYVDVKNNVANDDQRGFGF
jgi:hypothetical protein